MTHKALQRYVPLVLDKTWCTQKSGKTTAFNRGELIWARSPDAPCVTNFPRKHWKKHLQVIAMFQFYLFFQQLNISCL